MACIYEPAGRDREWLGENGSPYIALIYSERPYACAHDSSTEGRVLDITGMSLSYCTNPDPFPGSRPSTSLYTMEVITMPTESQPKVMGQVPCSPPSLSPSRILGRQVLPKLFFMFLFPACSSLSLHRQPERSFWNTNPIMSLSMNPFHGSTLLCGTQGPLTPAHILDQVAILLPCALLYLCLTVSSEPSCPVTHWVHVMSLFPLPRNLFSQYPISSPETKMLLLVVSISHFPKGNSIFVLK